MTAHAHSRWRRWEGRRWQVAAVVGLLLAFVGRRVPLAGAGALAVQASALILMVAGLVILLGPRFSRWNAEAQESVRRDPSGTKPPSPDERLTAVRHPRVQWLYLATVAGGFVLALAVLLVVALQSRDPALFGLAIVVAPPALFTSWLTWRARSVLRRPPAAVRATEADRPSRDPVT